MCNTDSKTYISVGELAQKAGVTIRTLQFYDQKGLLVPSIKGSRNRRLYSEEDQERLYAILCYKYMGLSLDEIREKLDNGAKPENITDALQREASELEKTISNNMKRYAVIKDLERLSSKGNDPDSWTIYSETIDYIKLKWELIWQFNNSLHGEPDLAASTTEGNAEMGQYYSLMTQALRLINEGIPPEDDAMMDIMEQYFKNKPDPSLIHIDPELMRIKDTWASDFWTDIKDYMHRAAEHYKKTRLTTK